MELVPLWSLGPDPPTCSNKKPTRMVAANRTGMAGADPLLIASWFEKEAGAMEQEKDWSFVFWRRAK